MMRFLVVAVALGALWAPTSAGAAPFFLFDRAEAVPNERVTVRTDGTPKTFRLNRRVKPFQQPLRLYLVRNDSADAPRSRLDRQLAFVGTIVPDKNGRGLLTFSVPPLNAGPYTVAYRCPSCPADSRRGRALVVQRPEHLVPPFRSQALLAIAPTPSCPVTRPNASRPPGQPRNVSWYGNGMLWAGVAREGVRIYPPDSVGADGSIGDKLLLVTTPPWERPTLTGERIDATAPALRVAGMNRGSFSGAANPSFMSPVSFPSAGCWRLTARLGDLSLTYVVEVVVR
jgi:hypothetical protein